MRQYYDTSAIINISMAPKLEVKITSIKITLILLIITIVGLCFVYMCLNTNRMDGSSPTKHSRIPRNVPNSGVNVPPKNKTIADFLMQKVRVLCWVMTYPQNHWKAMTVKNTWGKRCNIILFMSTKEDKILPTVKLNTSEGLDFLWGKTKEAWKYIYKNHREDADWFLKSDDDTYVVLENLRFHLSYYRTDNKLFFGSHIKSFKGYMDGGAGYVLSRAALDMFINKALPLSYRCKKSEIGREDVEMGHCLSNTEVKMVNTQDTFGRSRFLPFQLYTHIHRGNAQDTNINWYWKGSFYSEQPGLNCCSDYTITLHRVPPQKMYELEYLIYRLRPYGITYRFESRP